MNITPLTPRKNDGLEGAKIEIDAGMLGKFSMTGAIREESEVLGGHAPMESRYGESTAILRDGKHFLPWHVTAALTNNGDIERSWIADKDDATIVAEILKMRELYKSPEWFASVKYANQLTGQSVY